MPLPWKANATASLRHSVTACWYNYRIFILVRKCESAKVRKCDSEYHLHFYDSKFIRIIIWRSLHGISVFSVFALSKRETTSCYARNDELVTEKRRNA